MAEFKYKARDSKGVMIEQTLVADNATSAREKLRAANLFVIDITEVKAGADIVAKLNEYLEKSKKVTLKDMTIFSRQFATMINAGVSMARALAVLADQSENTRLRQIVKQIKDDVEQGSELSAALGKHPDVFSTLYVSMVKAGEMSGALDDVLNRLAVFLEKQSKLANEVKSAMTYPVVVLVIAVGIFFALLLFILPIFAGMFKQMNAQLPAFTQALINLSTFVLQWWWLIILVIVGSIFAFRQYRKTPQGKYNVDKQMLRAPVFGPLIQKVAVARFTRTFGTLIKSGVPLISALEIVGLTAGNEVVAEAVVSVRGAVSEGQTLSVPLAETKIFPPMVTQMIAIGEETGALDEMLTKIADFYDDEVEAAIAAMTSLLEPLMIVGIGGMVGSIVVGMYLPIFSIIQQIK